MAEKPKPVAQAAEDGLDIGRRLRCEKAKRSKERHLFGPIHSSNTSRAVMPLRCLHKSL